MRPIRGYTVGMKVAISLSDTVFEAAERYAARTQKSRSQLYAEALSEYLVRHGADEVTRAMNDVLERLGPDAEVDDFVAAAAARTLRRSEW